MDFLFFSWGLQWSFKWENVLLPSLAEKSGKTLKSELPIIAREEVTSTPGANKELFLTLSVVLLILYTCSPNMQTNLSSYTDGQVVLE